MYFAFMVKQADSVNLVSCFLVFLQFTCFHIRNATHRFSELPIERIAQCRGGKWYIGKAEQSIGYHQLGFCGISILKFFF